MSILGKAKSSADLLKAITEVVRSGDEKAQEEKLLEKRAKDLLYGKYSLQEKKKKMDPVGDADADIDNDGDTDDSDEYLHNRRKAIKKAMKEGSENVQPTGKKAVAPTASGVKVAPKAADENNTPPKPEAKSATIAVKGGAESAKVGDPNDENQKPAPVTTKKVADPKGSGVKKEEVEVAEAEDMTTANVDKALKHDCAKHVVHEKWGEGQCVPGMHTIVEDEDGEGHVTHYDVLFDHGVEESVPVEDLEIKLSESHMHKRKK